MCIHISAFFSLIFLKVVHAVRSIFSKKKEVFLRKGEGGREREGGNIRGYFTDVCPCEAHSSHKFFFSFLFFLFSVCDPPFNPAELITKKLVLRTNPPKNGVLRFWDWECGGEGRGVACVLVVRGNGGEDERKEGEGG